MEDRRDARRQVIALNFLWKSRNIPGDRKKMIESSLNRLKANIYASIPVSLSEELKIKRSIVSNLRGLSEVFHAFWLAFQSFAIDGVLTKEGHNKLNHSVQIALVGFGDFSDVQARIDNDWVYESQAFGPLNETGFGDLLFDTFELWTDYLDPTYFVTFGWILLDAIADVTVSPPALRPLREIKRIATMTNETDMMDNYLARRKPLLYLTLESHAVLKLHGIQNRYRAAANGETHTDVITVPSSSTSSVARQASPLEGDTSDRMKRMQNLLASRISGSDKTIGNINATSTSAGAASVKSNSTSSFVDFVNSRLRAKLTQHEHQNQQQQPNQQLHQLSNHTLNTNNRNSSSAQGGRGVVTPSKSTAETTTSIHGSPLVLQSSAELEETLNSLTMNAPVRIGPPVSLSSQLSLSGSSIHSPEPPTDNAEADRDALDMATIAAPSMSHLDQFDPTTNLFVDFIQSGRHLPAVQPHYPPTASPLRLSGTAIAAATATDDDRADGSIRSSTGIRGLSSSLSLLEDGATLAADKFWQELLESSTGAVSSFHADSNADGNQPLHLDDLRTSRNNSSGERKTSAAPTLPRKSSSGTQGSSSSMDVDRLLKTLGIPVTDVEDEEVEGVGEMVTSSLPTAVSGRLPSVPLTTKAVALTVIPPQVPPPSAESESSSSSSAASSLLNRFQALSDQLRPSPAEASDSPVPVRRATVSTTSSASGSSLASPASFKPPPPPSPATAVTLDQIRHQQQPQQQQQQSEYQRQQMAPPQPPPPPAQPLDPPPQAQQQRHLPLPSQRSSRYLNSVAKDLLKEGYSQSEIEKVLQLGNNNNSTATTSSSSSSSFRVTPTYTVFTPETILPDAVLAEKQKFWLQDQQQWEGDEKPQKEQQQPNVMLPDSSPRLLKLKSSSVFSSSLQRSLTALERLPQRRQRYLRKICHQCTEEEGFTTEEVERLLRSLTYDDLMILDGDTLSEALVHHRRLKVSQKMLLSSLSAESQEIIRSSPPPTNAASANAMNVASVKSMKSTNSMSRLLAAEESPEATKKPQQQHRNRYDEVTEEDEWSDAENVDDNIEPPSSAAAGPSSSLKRVETPLDIDLDADTADFIPSSSNNTTAGTVKKTTIANFKETVIGLLAQREFGKLKPSAQEFLATLSNNLISVNRFSTEEIVVALAEAPLFELKQVLNRKDLIDLVEASKRRRAHREIDQRRRDREREQRERDEQRLQQRHAEVLVDVVRVAAVVEQRQAEREAVKRNALSAEETRMREQALRQGALRQQAVQETVRKAAVLAEETSKKVEAEKAALQETIYKESSLRNALIREAAEKGKTLHQAAVKDEKARELAEREQVNQVMARGRAAAKEAAVLGAAALERQIRREAAEKQKVLSLVQLRDTTIAAAAKRAAGLSHMLGAKYASEARLARLAEERREKQRRELKEQRRVREEVLAERSRDRQDQRDNWGTEQAALRALDTLNAKRDRRRKQRQQQEEAARSVAARLLSAKERLERQAREAEEADRLAALRAREAQREAHLAEQREAEQRQVRDRERREREEQEEREERECRRRLEAQRLRMEEVSLREAVLTKELALQRQEQALLLHSGGSGDGGGSVRATAKGYKVVSSSAGDGSVPVQSLATTKQPSFFSSSNDKYTDDVVVNEDDADEHRAADQKDADDDDDDEELEEWEKALRNKTKQTQPQPQQQQQRPQTHKAPSREPSLTPEADDDDEDLEEWERASRQKASTPAPAAAVPSKTPAKAVRPDSADNDNDQDEYDDEEEQEEEDAEESVYNRIRASVVNSTFLVNADGERVKAPTRLSVAQVLWPPVKAAKDPSTVGNNPAVSASRSNDDQNDSTVTAPSGKAQGCKSRFALDPPAGIAPTSSVDSEWKEAAEVRLLNNRTSGRYSPLDVDPQVGLREALRKYSESQSPVDSDTLKKWQDITNENSRLNSRSQSNDYMSTNNAGSAGVGKKVSNETATGGAVRRGSAGSTSSSSQITNSTPFSGNASNNNNNSSSSSSSSSYGAATSAGRPPSTNSNGSGGSASGSGSTGRKSPHQQQQEKLFSDEVEAVLRPSTPTSTRQSPSSGGGKSSGIFAAFRSSTPENNSKEPGTPGTPKDQQRPRSARESPSILQQLGLRDSGRLSAQTVEVDNDTIDEAVGAAPSTSGKQSSASEKRRHSTLHVLKTAITSPLSLFRRRQSVKEEAPPSDGEEEDERSEASLSHEARIKRAATKARNAEAARLSVLGGQVQAALTSAKQPHRLTKEWQHTNMKQMYKFERDQQVLSNNRSLQLFQKETPGLAHPQLVSIVKFLMNEVGFHVNFVVERIREHRCGNVLAFLHTVRCQQMGLRFTMSKPQLMAADAETDKLLADLVCDAVGLGYDLTEVVDGILWDKCRSIEDLLDVFSVSADESDQSKLLLHESWSKTYVVSQISSKRKIDTVRKVLASVRADPSEKSVVNMPSERSVEQLGRNQLLGLLQKYNLSSETSGGCSTRQLREMLFKHLDKYREFTGDESVSY